jgi:hypothetical protein
MTALAMVVLQLVVQVSVFKRVLKLAAEQLWTTVLLL